MIDEALQVIASTRTGVLATLNEDGSPYTTPLTYLFEDGRFTWKSSPDAVHSQNIERNNRVSFCVIESVEGKASAVYINNQIVIAGETSIDEKWQTALTNYSLELGEQNIEQSTPGRFYFQGANA